MKILLIISSILFFPHSSTGQATNPNLDTALAKTLGADDYGMKKYVFVILTSGSNISESETSKESLFAGHLKNIGRLVELKKLILAGPFGKNENDFRGLFILNVSTIEEANKLLETDPAIKAKLLKPELYQWYGSAALPQYLKDHDRVWKIKP